MSYLEWPIGKAGLAERDWWGSLWGKDMMVKQTGGDRNEQVLWKPLETWLECLKKQHNEDKRRFGCEKRHDSYPLHTALTFQSELWPEWFYLDSRQHDSNQVVVWEQQGADDTAITDVLDDSCGGSRRTWPRTEGTVWDLYKEVGWNAANSPATWLNNSLFDELRVQIKTNTLCDFRTNAECFHHINHSIHHCTHGGTWPHWHFPPAGVRCN